MTSQALVRIQGLQRKIESDTFMDRMALALGSEKKARRFARMGVTAISANPDLASCDEGSLFTGLYRCAEFNMEPGILAHLVPFKGRVVFVPDYKGWKEAMYRSPRVAMLQCRIVQEGDEFDEGLGDKPHFKRVGPRDPSEESWIGAFATVKLVSGEWITEYMEKAEIQRIRDNHSASWNGRNQKASPWFSHPKPMYLKTVIKQLAKIAPVSLEATELAKLDDEAEVGAHQGTLIDVGAQIKERTEATLDDLAATIGAAADEPEAAQEHEVGGQNEPPASPPTEPEAFEFDTLEGEVVEPERTPTIPDELAGKNLIELRNIYCKMCDDADLPSASMQRLLGRAREKEKITQLNGDDYRSGIVDFEELASWYEQEREDGSV